MTRITAIALFAAAACGGSQTASTSGPDTSPDEPPPAAAPAPAVSPVAPDAAPAELGQPAPGFALPDLAGDTVELANYAGKTVVVEWFNPGCPFIVYAHAEGPLKDSAAIPGAGDDGVVWLAVNSGAPGKQGHGVDLNKAKHAEWAMGYPVLIDETGAVGKLYGARTTPHMYVIAPDGTLAYRGALDNAKLGQLEDGAEQRNYVAEALADLAAGQAVRTPETKPYGCSVKY